MQPLKDRIRAEGRVLPGNIIKVDGFLNHQVDVQLLRAMAKEFRLLFPQKDITKILTVEASGIALAAIAAEVFGVPMVFAKKAKSDNIEGGLYQSDIYSYTYKKKVTLLMSKQWLTPHDHVLIVDDFLANGEAIRGLIEIVEKSGATLTGVGIAIEKGFQPGGKIIREKGINLQSLAIIESAEENNIVFRE
ncbi:MAG: xanthine phosphoribosyltransferase [Clostridiales bacterium]|jgi:xanthine phosphoribosyltransferase|nr:xanthine phosphoribosyltransferase [Clostridiales bacterium]